MSAVRASIEIAAPPEEVWAVVMDPDRLGEWVTIHRGVKRVSDNPLRADSTMEQRLCLRGVSFNVTWKVKEFDPPHLAVMQGRGPARSQAFIRDELVAIDGGTRFDYVNEFRPPMGPLGSAAGRVLVDGLSEREAKASLQKLRALLEPR
jgi:uncharacterized protein YndB with AHSA1/START domain